MSYTRLLCSLAAALFFYAGQALAAGSVNVALSPSAAVTAGAQWRVDGGGWRNSGSTVKGLSAGTHTVEFKSVAGWITPASRSVTINNGDRTSIAQAYVQAASLRITLTPASGQWRIDGGAWHTSGSTATGLTPGSHTIQYAALSGYAAPAAESVTFSAGQALVLTRDYVQLAQLAITLSPANAQWRVDAGAWQASGATVSNLTPGPHTVDYANVTSYQTPASESVTLTAGQSLSLSRSYVQSVEIWLSLVPSSGQWRANGGAWQPSGARQFVPPGNLLVEYAPLEFYDPPASDNLTLEPGGIFYGTKHYTSTKPALRIYLAPSAGQWRLDGGAWQASGAQLTELATGTHTIDYLDLGGEYQPLASETITLALRQNFAFSRSYALKPASVSVTLTPSNAQWRVDGGAWQASGTAVTGLAAGSHTIDFAPLAGHNAPAPETITLLGGEAASFARTYTAQPAQLTVFTSPSGGQWRIYPAAGVPGGTWNASGATVGALAAGTYQVAFAPLSGYAEPATATITLEPGENRTMNGTYTSNTAQVTVALEPATGQWRVAGGAWQSAGATLAGVPAGTHLLEFADLAGYTKPLAQTITLSARDARNYRFLYATQAANSLLFNITPANALWRVDGGAWNVSGATIGGLTEGEHALELSTVEGYITPDVTSVYILPNEPHRRVNWTYNPGIANLKMALNPSNARWRINGSVWLTITGGVGGNADRPWWVEYEPVPGYATPHAEYIKLPPNPDYVTLTRTYQPTTTASMSLTLTPTHGLWRIYPAGVPGGAWRTGSATAAGLAPGTYEIDYGAIVHHGSPSVETVTLAAGQEVVLSRAYTTFPGQVTVNSSTPGAQWQISPAAGPASNTWLPAGTPATNLPPGDYVIKYAPVSGYDTPFQDTLTLFSAEICTRTKDYHPAYDLEFGLYPSTAQWRIDGGAWIASGSGVLNLASGSHLIEFSSVPGYVTPPAESITFNGARLQLYRSYVKLGEVVVSLWPRTAQWRINGGPWQASDAIVGNLALNTPHTIEYSAVDGWVTPPAETVTLTYSGQRLDLSRYYTELGKLTVALWPAGAQWRVNSGPWQASDATVTGLVLNTPHTVEYSSVAGWNAPPAETVNFTYSGQSISLSRYYSQ